VGTLHIPPYTGGALWNGAVRPSVLPSVSPLLAHKSRMNAHRNFSFGRTFHHSSSFPMIIADRWRYSRTFAIQFCCLSPVPLAPLRSLSHHFRIVIDTPARRCSRLAMTLDYPKYQRLKQTIVIHPAYVSKRYCAWKNMCLFDSNYFATSAALVEVCALLSAILV